MHAAEALDFDSAVHDHLASGRDTLGDGQDPMHVAQHRLLDQLAVDHDQAGVGLLEGADDSPRARDLLRTRREHRVDRRDLLGVNRALAREAEVAGLSRGDLHARRVFEIEVRNVDDVQAGVGRTGSWFSWQQLNFSPDIATTAKALANGLPIGVCVATEAFASAFAPGDHATTFGGGPVVCAAALAVLDEIEQHDLLQNCRERSDQLRTGLLHLDGVIDVRGRGLLLGAVLSQDIAGEVAKSALANGLVVNAVRPDTIRFAPPLSISQSEVDLALAALARSFD